MDRETKIFIHDHFSSPNITIIRFVIVNINERPNKVSQREINSNNFHIKTINHGVSIFMEFSSFAFETLNSTHTQTT